MLLKHFTDKSFAIFNLVRSISNTSNTFINCLIATNNNKIIERLSNVNGIDKKL